MLHFATWKHNWSIRWYMLLLQSKLVRIKVDLGAPMEFEGSNVFCIVYEFCSNKRHWYWNQLLDSWNAVTKKLDLWNAAYSFSALYLYSVLKQCGFCFLLVHLKSIITVAGKWKNYHGDILQARWQWPAEYFHKFLAVVSI